MDFEFDEDQLALQSAAAEVLAGACPATYLRSVIDSGHDPADLWKQLCSLDWAGIAIPAEAGGLGASAVELAIVVEQLGYVGDPTPFLATTTQFVPAVLACGDDEQRSRFLSAVVDEGRTGTLALAGPDGRWDLQAAPVRAVPADGGWRLSGTASYVIDGDRAAEIAVVAHTDDGPQLFVVPADAVRAERTPALDGSLHVADVHVDGAVVPADRRLADFSPAAFAPALDTAVTGLAMAMVGASQRALDLVIDYVKGREQFGVPIGSFQAVKHKVVDIYVAIERARALGYYAALTLAEDDPRHTVAASMAKAAAGDAQRLVFAGGIQLFGGIGFTWENDVQMYLRRAKAGELLLGGAAEHRLRVARTLLDAAEGTDQ